MEVVSLIEEVKDKFIEVDNRIDKLEDTVDIIQNNQAYMDEKIRDLKDIVVSNNSNVLQSLNTNNQLMSTIIMNLNDNKTKKEVNQNDNNTQLKITKDNNRTSLITKALVLFGAFIGGKNLDGIINWLKDLVK